VHVAFVSQPTARALPPSESIAIATLEVARRLVGRPGVDSVAIYSRVEPAPPPRVVDGVEHRHVEAVNDWRVQKVAARLWRGRVPFFASPLAHAGYGLAVARDLRRRRADGAVPTVVHVNNHSHYPPVLKRLVPGVGVVLHMHCEWLSDLHRTVVARRLRSVDAVVGCSDHVARLVEAPGKVHAIAHGVDLGAFAPPPAPRPAGRQRVLFVSRISPEKGVHVLVDAFAAVAARLPEAELRLVGAEGIVAREMLAGISRDPAVRRLAELSAPGYLERCLDRLPPEVRARVTLAGALDREAVAEEYRQADVFVSPSLSEAFGMSILEAMASGLPAVVSRVGGMPEIVADGDTGLVVPPDDPHALGDAVASLLEDPVRRVAMGEAGRRRAEEAYDWDAVADRFLALYEDVVRRR
jgi:glycosyltransferase involved in cell wall biosynthesis